MNLRQLRKLVNETVRSEQLKETVNRGRRFQIKNLFESTIHSILKEEDTMADPAEIMNNAGSPPVTLVVMYGPPAAGKGAAVGRAGEFAGVDLKGNFEDYLKGMKDRGDAQSADMQIQEEDKWMIRTSSSLGTLVFTELLNRLMNGEDYKGIIDEYFHTNESGEKFPLEKVAPEGFIKRLIEDMNGQVDQIVQYLLGTKRIQDYWTQARGFSKKIDGADPELNDLLGIDQDKKTLGIRLASQARYLDDVTQEIIDLFNDVERMEKGKYASIYLIDQAGESTTTKNEQRIKRLGDLKKRFPEGALKIIGVYVDQPAKRTEWANYHRASFGGRRVAQAEVDRIFAAAPTIEDGEVVENGPVLDAMINAGYDQVRVFTPPNPVEADATTSDLQNQEVPVGNAICEPFGAGTGHLDIEGCDDNATGPATRVSSFKDLEEVGTDAIGEEGDELPEEMSDKDADIVAKALMSNGFAGIDGGDIKNYVKKIKPGGYRDSHKKHGKAPWSSDLFTGDGMNPTKQITVKESLDLQRWQKLAGILKD